MTELVITWTNRRARLVFLLPINFIQHSCFTTATVYAITNIHPRIGILSDPDGYYWYYCSQYYY